MEKPEKVKVVQSVGYGYYPASEMDAYLADLEARMERMRVAVEQFEEWSNAYPESIFPEPDPKKVHEVCLSMGMSIDAISAMVLRLFTKRFGDLARAALADAPVVDDKKATDGPACPASRAES
jgi:hypothetical protein